MSFKFPELGKDFEMTGLWWLPEAPDDHLGGTLESQNGRLSLKLIGNFGSEIRLPSNVNTPIIFGVAEAKELTLLECFHAGTGFKVPGTTEQSFLPRYIFAGGHVLDGKVAQFKSFAVQFTDLGPWLMQTPITESFKLGEDKKLEEFSHVYRQAPKVTFPISKLPGELRYAFSFETRSDQFRSAGFEIAAYAGIFPEEPKDIDWFHSQIQPILDLQSLLVGRRVRIERLYAVPRSDESHDRIYDLIESFPPPRTEKERRPHEILVPLPEIAESFSTILDKWFEQQGAVKEPVSLFLGADASLPGEVRLLLLSQALESFHRNVYGGGYLLRQEYEPILAALVKAIPCEVDAPLRESLKSRLRYGYQYSLRRRLTALLQTLQDDTLAELKISRDEFVDKVKTARDFFTHWDPTSTKSSVKDFDLWNLVSKLEAITRLLLLKHVGVNEERILRRMLSNRRLYLEEYTQLH